MGTCEAELCKALPRKEGSTTANPIPVQRPSAVGKGTSWGHIPLPWPRPRAADTGTVQGQIPIQCPQAHHGATSPCRGHIPGPGVWAQHRPTSPCNGHVPVPWLWAHHGVTVSGLRSKCSVLSFLQCPRAASSLQVAHVALQALGWGWLWGGGPSKAPPQPPGCCVSNSLSLFNRRLHLKAISPVRDLMQ